MKSTQGEYIMRTDEERQAVRAEILPELCKMLDTPESTFALVEEELLVLMQERVKMLERRGTRPITASALWVSGRACGIAESMNYAPRSDAVVHPWLKTCDHAVHVFQAAGPQNEWLTPMILCSVNTARHREFPCPKACAACHHSVDRHEPEPVVLYRGKHDPLLAMSLLVGGIRGHGSVKGATAKDLAEAMDTQAGCLGNLLKHLQDNGLALKRTSRWHPTPRSERLIAVLQGVKA